MVRRRRRRFEVVVGVLFVYQARNIIHDLYHATMSFDVGRNSHRFVSQEGFDRERTRRVRLEEDERDVRESSESRREETAR